MDTQQGALETLPPNNTGTGTAIDSGDRVGAAPMVVAGGGMPAGRVQAARDAALVLVVPVLAFMAASHIEVAERYLDWSAGHEHWQADEVPFTLLALCAGLLWFAWRRAREARALRRRVQALTRHLLAVQEEERRHLARELHDEMGQRCAAIRFEAQCLLQGVATLSGAADHASATRETAAGVPRAQLAAVGDRLTVSARAIGESAAALDGELRRLLARLRPAALDALGLEAALGNLLDGWQRTYRVPVERRIGTLGALPDPVAIGIFRVVQEALTNVARHAQARCVRVRVMREGEAVSLEIEDDGCGFPAGGPPGGYGCGLTGVSERVAGLGGRLAITGEPGAGVRIAACLPVRGAQS